MTWKLEGAERAYQHFTPPFLLTTTQLYQRIRNIQLRLSTADSENRPAASRYACLGPGTDDEFYAKLITDYLQQSGQASRVDIDKLLVDKLSDALTSEQKQRKIDNPLC